MGLERMKPESSPGTSGAESTEGAGEIRFTPEEADRSWHQERFRLNGQEIEIVGVAHVPETIERHGAELEDAVRRAALVVLEVAPQATDIFSEKTATIYAELHRALGRDITPAEAASELRQEPIFRFFADMEDLAAKHQKDIVVVDPMSTSKEGIVNVYSRTMLQDTDDTVDVIKAFTFGAGALGVIVPELVARIRRKGEVKPPASPTDREKRKVGSPEPGGMGRRRFLQLMAGGLAAAALGSDVASSLKKKGHGGRGENPLGAALYDGTDYRDVITASGLEKITRSTDLKGPVVLIGGDEHRVPIRHYAESPLERTAKEKAYAPYAKVITPRLRRFRHDAERGWQVTREEELS